MQYSFVVLSIYIYIYIYEKLDCSSETPTLLKQLVSSCSTHYTNMHMPCLVAVVHSTHADHIAYYANQHMSCC